MRKACCCGQPFREVRASRKIPRATWRWRDVSWVLPGFAASWVEKLVSKWLMVTGSDFSRPNYWTFNCFTANPSSHPTWGGEEKDWVGGRYRATLRCTMWVSECIWWFFYGIWWLLMPACMHYVSILPLLAWWHFAITTLDFATEPKWEVHGLVRKTKPCFGVTGHRMCQSSTDGPRRESTSWNTHEAS